MSLGRLRRRLAHPTGPAPEPRAECLDHLAYRAEGCRVRTEINSARRAFGRRNQGFRQSEVTGQRFEHVLPGPHRIGIAQGHRLSRFEPADTVRNETVLRPIAAADDITRARSGERRAILKKTLAKTRRHQFSAGLAAAVGIVTPQSVVFRKSAALASAALGQVLVHLVAGDDHDAFEMAQSTACLQQRRGTHHIGRISAKRIAIGFSDQRLRRHVNHDLRIRPRHRLCDALRIADVGDHRARYMRAEYVPKIRFIGRRQGISRDLRAQGLKP